MDVRSPSWAPSLFHSADSYVVEHAFFSSYFFPFLLTRKLEIPKISLSSQVYEVKKCSMYRMIRRLAVGMCCTLVSFCVRTRFDSVREKVCPKGLPRFDP